MDRRPRGERSPASLLAAACVGAGPGEAASITFPGSNWTQVDPASVNVDPGTLNQAIALGKSRHGQGMITRWGNLVGSWGNIYTQSRLSSATKAWSSLVTGLAIDDHLFAQTAGRRPSTRASSGSRTRPDHDQWLSQITIHQLLTMTAGFGSNTDGFAPLKFAPGTTWFYSNSAVDALGDVVTYAFDRDLLDVLRERILRPIGVADSEVRWQVNPKRDTRVSGNPNREFAGSLFTDPNAMARVGLLLMSHGNWNGKQLISSDYVGPRHAPAGRPGQARGWSTTAWGRTSATACSGSRTRTARCRTCRGTRSSSGARTTCSRWWCRASAWSRRGRATRSGTAATRCIEPIMTLMAQAMR